MSRTLSRFLTLLGICPEPLSPQVARALDLAASQQALFQVEVQHGKTQPNLYYLKFSKVTPEGLELVPSDPSFSAPPDWIHKTFLFKYLAETDPAKPPLLHKFQSKVLSVAKDRRILISLPQNIIVLEQRRNVRIKLHRKHMPHMAIWGVHNSFGETKGITLNHHLILDLSPAIDETARTLKNISAGGMRISLSPHVLAQNRERLEEGRKLIVQLIFSGSPFSNAKHLLVSKVCNVHVEKVERPEIGIQFLASRVHTPHPHWKELGHDGCERLARVVHSFQMQYYAEIKQRLAIQGGTISVALAQELRPRGRT